MQNANVYSIVNKATGKYSDILKFLKKHEDLLEWEPEEKVLDVGCGPGDVTAHALQQWLPSHFRCALGMDVSTEMIQHAQATYGNVRLDFTTFDMDSESCDEVLKGKYSGGFDKVFSFYTLHWFQQLEKAVKNFYGLMKPGGQGLVTFPIDRYFQRTFKIVHAKGEWSKYFKNVSRKLPPFPRTSDPASEFQHMLETAGFEVATCEVSNIYCYFDTAKEFKGLMESLEPDMSCVPGALKEQYLSDCFAVMRDMDAIRMEMNSVRQTKVMFTLVCAGLVESLEPDMSCVPGALKEQYLSDCFAVMEDTDAIRMEMNSVRQTKVMLTLVCAGLVESLEPDMNCVPGALKEQYLSNCFAVMEDTDAIRMEMKSVRQTKVMLTLDCAGLVESLEPDMNCVPGALKEQYLSDCFTVMRDMDAIRMEEKSVRQTKVMLTCVFRKPKLY